MPRIPKIIGDIWFNGDVNERDLKGKVLLIDFWTYSCVNCLRTLPYLKEWWEKYKDKDFLLIGVHTPEFEFEKDPINVEKAVRELDIKWPVVLDDTYINWNNFTNKYWPAKYLINQKGEIVYQAFGEGNYVETEGRIQSLLRGRAENLPLVKENFEGNICFIPTPEIYFGFKRGRIANQGGYSANRNKEYIFHETLGSGAVALNGKFVAAADRVESRSQKSALFLNFMGSEINAVIEPAHSHVSIEVLFNNNHIFKTIKGRDVSENGIVEITEPKMYNLLKTNFLTSGTLEIRPKIGNFRIYSFTFSGCVNL